MGTASPPLRIPRTERPTRAGWGPERSGSRTTALAALVMVGLVTGHPSLTVATHAPDHRFVVLGYVLDEQGQPRRGVPVVVTRLKTGLRYPTRSGPDGFYLVVVHLHDEDVGEPLAVETPGARGEITVRFDPGDPRSERGTRVDVRGARVLEEAAAFGATLRAILDR